MCLAFKLVFKSIFNQKIQIKHYTCESRILKLVDAILNTKQLIEPNISLFSKAIEILNSELIYYLANMFNRNIVLPLIKFFTIF